ncbi:MAG: lysophospholipid acyltransferase family protein [Patescibacteria group bacterium]
MKNFITLAKAYGKTLGVGFPAIAVLAWHMKSWSTGQRGHYIYDDVARARWATHILRYAGIKLTVNGADIFESERYFVVTPNHTSVLDLPLIISLVPNGRFIFKMEVKRIPIINAAAYWGGQIPINRSDHVQSMKTIRDGVAEWRTCNLINFPEGTRSRERGKLGPFKFGAARIAIENGYPILPVSIQGAGEALKKDCTQGSGRALL